MAVTQNSYTGNGTTTNYSFTFPYLKQSEIKASLDATVSTAFSIPNATTVQFNTAPANGVKIKIYRETDSDSLAATFYAGSAIKSEDLNDNFTQNLYSTQEVTERYLSNLGGTMVGDLALGEDVVVKFEGATDNDYETTLTVADPTADRTITLPNITGTIVTTGDTGTVATGMIANDAINGTKIADDSVDSEHIAADSLDSEHYAPNSVDTTALNTDSVTTVKITDLNVTTAKIANLAVGTNQIAADAINGGKIADDSIDSEHYVADSIDTEHYAPNSVDADALAHTSVTAGTYTATDLTVDAQGRITAASSGTIARSEIAADAIDGTKLADNAVDSEHYTDGSIDHVHLANDVIDGDNIQDDVINSEHYAAGSIDTEHIANLQVTTAKIAADAIDGTKIADNAIGSEHVAANSIGDSEIATGALDNRYYTETESDARYFNISTGDTIKDGDTFPDNDTTIATTAAINDRIIDLVDDVGGFVPIANETSFPAANPDVNNGAGTLVSIKALASNLVSNGSGVATISNGAGSGNTVTITGLANSTTYAATFGLIVETTSTLHTYAFHRQVPIATEVSTVAGSISNVNTVAGSISNVNTVASNNSNVTTVAGVSSNVTTVAGVASNVTTVAGIASNVTAVAGDATDIGAVAAKATEIGRLGTADAVADMNTLGTTAIVSDLDTCATNVSNINTAAGSISNINTVATNISNVNDFSDKYRVASSAPTSSLDTGDLYFDTSANELKVYNGSAWQGGVTATGNLAGLGANTFTGHQSLGDNLKVQLGAGNDLQIYHTGTNSYVANSTGLLQIKNTDGNIDSLAWNDVLLRVNAGEMAVDCSANGSVELYYDNVKKIETTSTGVTLRGTNHKVEGLLRPYSAVNTDLGTDADRFRDLYIYNDIDIKDDGKILLGNSDDIQIYHDGTESWFRNSTGTLNFTNDGWVQFKNAADNEFLLTAESNSAVQLYYDNSKKLYTHSAGVSIDGNLSLTDADGREIRLGASNDLKLYHDGSNNFIDSAAAQSLFIRTSQLQILGAGGGETLAKFNDDGAVELYYNNLLRLVTTSDGIQFQSEESEAVFSIRSTAQNGAPTLQFLSDDNDDNADRWRIRADGGGAALGISNYASGSWEKNIECNEDGNVELYYDNVKKLETSSTGVYVRASGSSGFWIDNQDNAGKDIEFVANANKLKFNDNVSATFGSGDDLSIYHNGVNSVIYDNGTGNLSLMSSGGSIVLEKSNGEPMGTFAIDGAVALYWDGASRFSTTSYGVSIIGDALWGDGRKAVFGNDGLDLQIQHDGDDSYISHGNVGHLFIRTASTDKAIKCVLNGGVELHYDDAKKFETTSVGVTVTGTVSDSKGDLRKIIQNSQSSAHTLTDADAGKHIYISSGGVTVPVNLFATGDAVTIVNHSGSDQTITQASGVTIYNTADGTTGNRTLAGRGMCTLLKTAGNEFYISGAGLS